MATKLRRVYQLKVSINGTKPPIWRRFLTVDTIRLDELHMLLQVIMGWTDSHLHQFISHGTFYGVPDEDYDLMDMEVLDETRFRLNQLLKTEKASIVYEYDFGDGWNHKITLEKILPFDVEQAIPVCVKAKGACPPEDVGGTWGYYEFLEALEDINHPEHESYKEWVGGDFDPEFYSIQDVNNALIELRRVFNN